MKRMLLTLLAALGLIVPTLRAQGETATSMSSADFAAKAQDGVITLTGDVTLTSKWTIGTNETFTLDLGDYTLTPVSGISAPIKVLGKLTVKGGSAGKIAGDFGGKDNWKMIRVDGEFVLESGQLEIYGTSANNAVALCVDESGKATLNGGTIVAGIAGSIGVASGSTAKKCEVTIGAVTIEASGQGARAVSVLNGNTTISIDGATLIASGDGAKCAEIAYATASNRKLVITNSTLKATGAEAYGVYGGGGTIEVTGCTIESTQYGVYNKDAQMKVANSTVEAADAVYSNVEGSSAGTIAIESGTFVGDFQGKNTDVTISGGTFLGLSEAGKEKVTASLAEGVQAGKDVLLVPADVWADGKGIVYPETFTDAPAFIKDFPEGKTVSDGTTYYATMQDAIKAVHLKEGEHTLWCKPGATIAMTKAHAHVCQSLTVYGNGATVTGGEHDFELDTYTKVANTGCDTECKGITGEVTLEIHALNEVAVWGQRTTTHTLNVTLEDCKNVTRVLFRSSQMVDAVNNLTLRRCTFSGDGTGINAGVVHSVYAGSTLVEDCVFTAVGCPININNKTSLPHRVTVKKTTFNRCGIFTNVGEKDETAFSLYAAPIRLVAGGANASVALSVEGCTFTYNDGDKKYNGDILLGDGRVGQTSHPNVTATIVNTAASVQVQQPGDRTATESHPTQVVEVVKGEEATTITNVPPAVAAIGDTTYATLQAAIDAAQTGDTVTLLMDVIFNDFDVVFGVWASEWGEKYETEPEAAKAALVPMLNDRLLTLDRDVTITLDLAGHTISSDVGYLPETLPGENDPYPCGTLMLKQGNLTLKDSSTTGTGEIRGASMAVFQRGGTLTVQGGTYRPVGGESEWVDSMYPIAALWTADGMCTIEGGTFHAGGACVSAEPIPDLSPDSAAPSVTIKGGRFEGFPVGRVTVDAQVLVSDEEGMLVSYRTFADFAQAHAETFDYDGETSLLRLKADYSPEGGFFVNGDVTIDLNGHKWTFPKDGQLFCNSGTVVTLQDSAGTGCLSQAAPSQESVIVTRGAFTLSSGTIGTADTAMHGIIVAGNAALTINGGTIYGVFSAIAEASNNDGKCTITINGGTQIVQQWAGCPFLPDQSGAPSTVTCTVTGGSYELKESPDEDRKKLKANLSKYCAADYVVLKNADGTYDVVQGEWAAEVADEKYATLQEAVEAAEAATSDPLPTITLLRDVVLEDTVTLTKNLSIDLAGYTLYAPNPSTPAFTADSQVTVTLSKKEDGTVNGRLIAAGQKPEHNVTIDGVLSITKWTEVYDLSWYNFTQAPAEKYILTTPEQLGGLAILLSEAVYDLPGVDGSAEFDFSKTTFELGADIDLAGLEWVPPEYLDGTFDGMTHTIKNLYTKEAAGYVGFFGEVAPGAVVQNLIVESATFEAKPARIDRKQVLYLGAIAGVMDGTVRRCVTRNCSLTAVPSGTTLPDTHALGGLVGTVSGGERIVDCSVEGSSFQPETATFGTFAGKAVNDAEFIRCYVDGALTQTTGTLMNVYTKNGDTFVRYNTVADSNAPSGELGEAAALNGIGWLLNGQKTEGALTWRVDSNEDCKTLLPFEIATVATIPEVECYLTQDGNNYYANGHEATVTQAIVEDSIATVLQTQRDDYKVNEALTIAAPTMAVVYPGTPADMVDAATLTVDRDIRDIQVCLDTVKSVTLKGTGVATLASASISAGQTVTLEDGVTLKVPGGVTLAVAGTVTVTNGSFIGTDGTSSVDIAGSGSVTNLEEGLSVWNLAKKTWERAALVSADGTVYYPSVAAAIEANPSGGVRLLAPIADDAVKATSKETVTGTAAYDVADVLGGAFKVVGTSLVYDYDLGVGGLTIVKDAKGDLVVEMTVKLAEGEVAPTRTLEGCTLTVTSTLNGAAKTFPLVGTLTFTNGECKVTIPYTEDNFPMGTNRLTVSISKGVGEGTP